MLYNYQVSKIQSVQICVNLSLGEVWDFDGSPLTQPFTHIIVPYY